MNMQANVIRNRNQRLYCQSNYSILGECPKTHKYAYNKGKWCCNTNKDCDDKPLKMTSDCCQYYAYKQCPSKKCENHRSGKNLFLELIKEINLYIVFLVLSKI